MNLTELANHYGSDKGTKEGLAHGYTEFYSFLFEQFRDLTFDMLELGLQRGGKDQVVLRDRQGNDIPSIRMWQNYFPKATIHGFDLSDFSDFDSEQVRTYRGDVGSAIDLARLTQEIPRMQIIVDDASHAAWHQQYAFGWLFPMIVPGGFYIIEDTHATHPIEKDLPPCRRTADAFLNMSDYGGHLTIPAMRRQIRNVYYHRKMINGVDTVKMIAVEKR